VLPSVARPIMAVYDEATIALTELPANVELRLNRVQLRTETQINARVAPAESVAFAAPVAPIGLAVPIAASGPVAPTVPSVTFAGVYTLPDAPVARSVDAPSRWSTLGTPGVEIASAAKKTSVGVANAVSRAGVSLARRF